MSKNLKCAFCGKEIVSGWFSGTAAYIDVGTFVDCCEECHDQYKPYAKEHKERFSTKLENYKRATKKKLTGKEVADMFVAYLEEEKECYNKTIYADPDMFKAFYVYDSDYPNYFSTREFGTGFLKSDISAKRMVKSLEKSEDTLCCCFDKNDITKIEYAPIGSGDPLGLFKQAFSYAIRLNDETVMTYKPCIARTAVLGSGFLFGYKKSANKKMVKILNEFKNQIGSDLPIVKVKKI